MSKPRQHGFTLIEALITVTVLAILLGLAVPAMTGFVERNRLKGAAEDTAAAFQLARTEAIKRNAPIFVTFDTDAWCFGFSETTGCDCTVADPANASACALAVSGTNVLKVISGDDYPGVTVSSMTFSGTPPVLDFDPVRGTAKNGRIEFESPRGLDLQVRVITLGRISICSQSDNVTGYPGC